MSFTWRPVTVGDRVRKQHFNEIADAVDLIGEGISAEYAWSELRIGQVAEDDLLPGLVADGKWDHPAGAAPFATFTEQTDLDFDAISDGAASSWQRVYLDNKTITARVGDIFNITYDYTTTGGKTFYFILSELEYDGLWKSSLVPITTAGAKDYNLVCTVTGVWTLCAIIESADTITVSNFTIKKLAPNTPIDNTDTPLIKVKHHLTELQDALDYMDDQNVCSTHNATDNTTDDASEFTTVDTAEKAGDNADHNSTVDNDEHTTDDSTHDSTVDAEDNSTHYDDHNSTVDNDQNTTVESDHDTTVDSTHYGADDADQNTGMDNTPQYTGMLSDDDTGMDNTPQNTSMLSDDDTGMDNVPQYTGMLTDDDTGMDNVPQYTGMLNDHDTGMDNVPQYSGMLNDHDTGMDNAPQQTGHDNDQNNTHRNDEDTNN